LPVLNKVALSSPIDVASDSEGGYDDAIRALDRRAREIEAQRRANERKAKAVAELAAAMRSVGSPASSGRRGKAGFEPREQGPDCPGKRRGALERA
jgi:hypothetical protein